MAGLGKTQLRVFDVLCRKHSWHRGCGWIWSTASATERVLDSLVKRELVEVTNGVYRVSESGKLVGIVRGNLSPSEASND